MADLRLTVADGTVTVSFGGVDVSVSWTPQLSARDRANLRWYFEDYLEYPTPAGEELTVSIEHRMRELGRSWFDAIFAREPAESLWRAAEPLLDGMRVEIEDRTPEGDMLPWELLRLPDGSPLALRAASFVRVPVIDKVTDESNDDNPLRVLLVVARPAGNEDVPFRSVAQPLVRSLRRMGVEVEVLRPPTFRALRDRLGAAHADGRPLQVVHFDGHGRYTDLVPRPVGATSRPRGYVVFEDPGGNSEGQLVPGATLGKLLAATGVRILGLNACRSAHAAAERPEDTTAVVGPTEHERESAVAAFPSFASEVLGCGVPGVVAMHYNVYVATATAVVGRVYEGLVAGGTLGESVSAARRGLADEPVRTVLGRSRSFADWSVPLVFEARPVRFLPSATAEPAPAWQVDAAVPPPPAVGVVGRDDVLLRLDRAFDEHPVVVLHGLAGSGKSVVAAEFVRWYADTAGGRGAVLWSSFRQLKSPDDLLDKAAAELHGLRPELWVWDNVETVAEPGPYAELLARLSDSGVRLLLTSRREEHDWLPDAAQLSLPPLRSEDRIGLIAELLAARSEPLTDVGQWLEVAGASRGNPMILEALVDCTLSGHQQVVAGDLVGSLRSALGNVDDEVLRVLALCQGFTDLALLHFTGLEEIRCRPVLERLSAIGAAQQVTGGVWMLHPVVSDLVEQREDDLRERYVWSVAALGEKYNTDWRSQGAVGAVGWARAHEDNLLHAYRICVEDGQWFAMVGVLSGLRVLYESEHRFGTWDRILDALRDHVMLPDTEEPRQGRENLWDVYTELLVQRGMRNRELGLAFRLQQLRIKRDLESFSDLLEDPPDWSRNPQAKNFLDRYDDPAARSRALQLLRADLVRSLGVSYDDLGQILAAAGSPGCLDAYHRALDFFAGIDDGPSMARTLGKISDAHCRLPDILDLDMAEQTALESYRLRAEKDFQGRAKSCGQLGNIALAKANRLPPDAAEERKPLIRDAVGWLERALAATPHWARADTAPAHNQLGMCLLMLGDLAEGRRHYVQAIADYEASGDFWYAASSAVNLGAGLLQFQRYDEAAGYAKGALEFFRRIGDEEQIVRAEGLLRISMMMSERFPVDEARG